MKNQVIIVLTLLISQASLAQTEVAPAPEKTHYKYTYGGSVGYYYENGFGINLHAKYNFRYVSIGGMGYIAKPDPYYYNYLGQAGFNRHIISSPKMTSVGALLKMEINVVHTKYIGMYGAGALGIGYSSYTYVYDGYTSEPESKRGYHLNYSLDAGMKIHANNQLDIFGEIGIGTSLLKLGALWSM